MGTGMIVTGMGPSERVPADMYVVGPLGLAPEY